MIQNKESKGGKDKMGLFKTQQKTRVEPVCCVCGITSDKVMLRGNEIPATKWWCPEHDPEEIVEGNRLKDFIKNKEVVEEKLSTIEELELDFKDKLNLRLGEIESLSLKLKDKEKSLAVYEATLNSKVQEIKKIDIGILLKEQAIDQVSFAVSRMDFTPIVKEETGKKLNEFHKEFSEKLGEGIEKILKRWDESVANFFRKRFKILGKKLESRLDLEINKKISATQDTPPIQNNENNQNEEVKSYDI